MSFINKRDFKQKVLLIATTNKGKLREISYLLEQAGIEFISLNDVDNQYEVEEDKDSFLGNAKKKATEYGFLYGFPTLADDSGLMIDALNGFPGVKSARFAGGHHTGEFLNKKILEIMEEQANRKAKMISYLYFYNPINGKSCYKIGEIKGEIGFTSKGDNGFGFDRIFKLEDGEYLAEKPQIYKLTQGMRAKAVQKIIPCIKNFV